MCDLKNQLYLNAFDSHRVGFLYTVCKVSAVDHLNWKQMLLFHLGSACALETTATTGHGLFLKEVQILCKYMFRITMIHTFMLWCFGATEESLLFVCESVVFPAEQHR